MSPEDYTFLLDLLKKESGLSLTAGKEYLITSRLDPVAASMGLTNLQGLIRRLRIHPDAELVQTVCEAMTTNETLFFRDAQPFENLQRTVFPALTKKCQNLRRLRIWCAACSTGQEPYSIAMMIEANFPQLKTWQIEILGTDISTEALERARAGRYTQFEIQRGLPVQMLVRFFKQEGRDWVAVREIRNQVTFREFNLLQPFAQLGQFDIIFCRNILIYFDTPTKSAVLRRLAGVLARDGYLFLGGAETVLGLSENFERAEFKGNSYMLRRMANPAASSAL